MPKIIWFQSCRRILVDGPTNNLSLIDVIEEVSLMTSQSVYGEQLCLVSLWDKDISYNGQPENFCYRLRLRSPNGEFVADTEVPLEQTIPATVERLRSMITLVGLPIKESGRYEWILELQSGGDWTEVGRLPLMVKHNDIPAPE